jgi:uncharacterized membrane protein
MKTKSKNNQEIVKMQMISLILSFIFFNAILKETDWLITSSIVLLIVLIIVVRIWGERRSENVKLANSNYPRRMS